MRREARLFVDGFFDAFILRRYLRVSAAACTDVPGRRTRFLADMSECACGISNLFVVLVACVRAPVCASTHDAQTASLTLDVGATTWLAARGVFLSLTPDSDRQLSLVLLA